MPTFILKMISLFETRSYASDRTNSFLPMDLTSSVTVNFSQMEAGSPERVMEESSNIEESGMNLLAKGGEVRRICLPCGQLKYIAMKT